ncbi:MAG TPA: hypothetical protein VKG92_05755 [Flavobacteriales bacterium]|nr:hypothetical protein [Flavobacteriales bacterium]
MTLYEFQKLDVAEQAAHLWYNGSFVSADVGTPATFYVLNEFFVEVVGDAGTFKAHALVPFRRGPRYERMVNHIELDL